MEKSGYLTNDTLSKKPKVMLHIIVPSQISGPNTASKIISESFLSYKYDFGFLVQKKRAGGFFNIRIIVDLCKQIKAFDPDIIHLSGLQSSAFHAIIAARLCMKRKTLIAIRGTTRDAETISYFRRYIFSKVIEPITLKLSSSFYTVCEAMAKRDYIKAFSEKFLGTIHNPAPKSGDTESLNDNLREELGLGKDQILVAIVGRLVYDKGVTYIAKAIKELKRKDLTFVFIGDGSALKDIIITLKDKIEKKKVFLLGQKNNVQSLLPSFDIFLFATLHENLSNALLEAASAGLAIIATNTGGNPEVIEHQKSGLLIPVKDSQSIKDALTYLAEKPEMRKFYGNSAKERVEKYFSQESLFIRLDEVYKLMLIRK